VIGAALFHQLSNDQGVAALVGTRIVPSTAPMAATYPQIVYELKSPEAPKTHQGPSDITKISASAVCIATTYAGAQALASAVKTALVGQNETWGDGTEAESIAVRGCFWDDMDEDTARDAEANVLYYTCELTFTIWYKG
jgi:hypothetical protein